MTYHTIHITDQGTGIWNLRATSYAKTMDELHNFWCAYASRQPEHQNFPLRALVTNSKTGKETWYLFTLHLAYRMTELDSRTMKEKSN